MTPWIVAGGGLAGLLGAERLRLSGVDYVGLEKESALGGDFLSRHTRIFERSSIEWIDGAAPGTEWDFVDERGLERRKGEWRIPEEESLDDAARFLLRDHFYRPRAGYGSLIARLIENNAGAFQLRVTIERVLGEQRKIVGADGREWEYESLLWTAPLEALQRAWEGDKSPLLRLAKAVGETPRGVCLEMEVNAPLFPNQGSVLFPFRFKDLKLEALGQHRPAATPGRVLLTWLLVVDRSLAEDREELAKAVRALKRELMKEFPELADLGPTERIVYLPRAVDGDSVEVKSLEILPNVFYLGPEVRLAQAKENVKGLDRVLDNCHFLAETLVSQRSMAKTILT